MRGSAGPWLIDKWMTLLTDTVPYAALHTGVPNPDDPTANEVTGAWYARKVVHWDLLDETATANAGPIIWKSTGSVTLAGIAVYLAATGSDLVLWCPYATPQALTNGGTLTIAAHDLFVEIV